MYYKVFSSSYLKIFHHTWYIWQKLKSAKVCKICKILTDFTYCSGVSIVDLEQVNASWEGLCNIVFLVAHICRLCSFLFPNFVKNWWGKNIGKPDFSSIPLSAVVEIFIFPVLFHPECSYKATVWFHFFITFCFIYK